MAEVKLVNVSKIYEGKNKAVDSVSLEILDKEFVVLVGPSGCGKSTTLRMIAGLEEVSEGELYIDGKPVKNVSPAERDIAMVFQNYALYPHMTVFENMAFGLKLRKFSKSEISERVNYAAALLDIETLLERKPKQLSGGQRQRVAVGRAIVRKPKVFLFDEPLSNLDAKLRVQMRTEISKLHRKLGATMIYVTHDQTEAMTMGDRIVVMNDGRIQQADKPLEIYNNPVNRFVAGFIGSPSMNFIEGKLSGRDKLMFNSSSGDLSFEIPESYKSKLAASHDKNLLLGVRPENISIGNSGEGNQIVFKAKLEVVEPMGSEIFIYFDLNGSQMTGRIPAGVMPDVGDEISLRINGGKLHFFDSQNNSGL